VLINYKVKSFNKMNIYFKRTYLKHLRFKNILLLGTLYNCTKFKSMQIKFVHDIKNNNNSIKLKNKYIIINNNNIKHLII